MPKPSQFPPVTSLTTSDLLLLIQAAGPTDSKVTLANLIKSIYTVGQNPYKFSVYRNAAWTDGNSAWVKVPFDTKEFDTGSNVDIVTNVGRFTAPVAGFYQFNAAVSAPIAINSLYVVGLYKNGSLFKQGNAANQAGGTQTATSPVVALVQLAANDYVEIFHWGTGGAGGTGANQTYFSGFLVSAT